LIYYVDAEFSENGSSIELISFGVVAEDGREFYRECSEYDAAKCSAWVRSQVLSKLAGKKPKTLEEIRQDLLDFIGDDRHPRFVAYVSAYDQLCLALLFGGMHSLPDEYPHYMWDLRQWLDDMHIDRAPRLKRKGRHHALEDAKWLRDICDSLRVTQGLVIPPNNHKKGKKC